MVMRRDDRAELSHSASLSQFYPDKFGLVSAKTDYLTGSQRGRLGRIT